ncbi:MAG: hypothetical protein ACR2QC_07875 [Gammaproteobacteria bacterium]
MTYLRLTLILLLTMSLTPVAWAACEIVPAGLYQLYVQDGFTRCTVEVRVDGTIRKQRSFDVPCRGSQVNGPITGGRLTLFEPRGNPAGLGRCLMDGVIKVNQSGRIVRIHIFQANATSVERDSLGLLRVNGWTGWLNSGRLFTMMRF